MCKVSISQMEDLSNPCTADTIENNTNTIENTSKPSSNLSNTSSNNSLDASVSVAQVDTSGKKPNRKLRKIRKSKKTKDEIQELKIEVTKLRKLLQESMSIVNSLKEKMDIQKKSDVRLISGSSHHNLAQMIASELDVPLTKCKMSTFSNSETRIQLEESVRGKHVYFIQTGGFDSELHKGVNDYIMETALALDAVAGSAKSITLFVPCFPYARQDKKDSSRAAISARTVSQIFQMNGNLKRVVTVDLHSASIQGLFTPDIACDNLYCIKPICDYLYDNVFKTRDPNDYGSKYVAISPDEGALKRVSIYASQLNLKHMQMSKQRDYSKNNVVDETMLLGNPKWLVGNTAIIFDDMIDTGGTMIKAVECLVEKGANDAIIVVAHGILSGSAIERINNCDLITSVIVSDSLPQEKNLERCPKLRTFTLSKMYAEVVTRIIEGQSISDMFYNKE